MYRSSFVVVVSGQWCTHCDTRDNRRLVAARRGAFVAPSATAADAEAKWKQPESKKPKLSREHARRRGRAAQPDAARPSRSSMHRDSTPRAARGRRRCRRSRPPEKQPEAPGAKISLQRRRGGWLRSRASHRRCLPEITPPPREAGASRSGERHHKRLAKYLSCESYVSVAKPHHRNPRLSLERETTARNQRRPRNQRRRLFFVSNNSVC